MKSVMDDSELHLNDSAPDLIGKAGIRNFLMVSLRVPAPASVPHSGQGPCPGVGVVRFS